MPSYTEEKYTNHPNDSTKVKLTNLQAELQSMITEAKSEYKSNLALAYAHSYNSRIFQYKGNDRYPTPIFYNDKQASTDSDKA